MNCNLTRREFIRNAVMLAGAGFTVPLWAAMKYDRDAVMRYFRESGEAMNARVKAGIEANRKGDATLLFMDSEGGHARESMRRYAKRATTSNMAQIFSVLAKRRTERSRRPRIANFSRRRSISRRCRSTG